MFWASKHDQRVRAEPGLKAICPCCGNEVLAKCGKVNVWHWAHKSNDCDPWHEPESEWHLMWKDKFPSSWQEVVQGMHRADVQTPHRVLEFQSSHLSVDDIAAREAHYGNMTWILNATQWAQNFWWREHKPRHGKRDYVSFRWKHPRKTWWNAERQVTIDCGGQVLVVKRIHHDLPCGGWGYFVTHNELVTELLKPRPWWI